MKRFGWIADRQLGDVRPPYDIPVMQTNGFVALPTLGALVPGWLLIVPRRRTINFSTLLRGEYEELKCLVDTLQRQLMTFSGQVFVFEHGAAKDSAMACGVDQAHLHIAPLSFDLFSAVVERKDVKWQMLSSIEDILEGEELEYDYLAISDLDKRTALGRPNRIVSQWFRRIIANKLGKPERWDYQKYPNLELIHYTTARIGSR